MTLVYRAEVFLSCNMFYGTLFTTRYESLRRIFESGLASLANVTGEAWKLPENEPVLLQLDDGPDTRELAVAY